MKDRSDEVSKEIQKLLGSGSTEIKVLQKFVYIVEGCEAGSGKERRYFLLRWRIFRDHRSLEELDQLWKDYLRIRKVVGKIQMAQWAGIVSDGSIY